MLVLISHAIEFLMATLLRVSACFEAFNNTNIGTKINLTSNLLLFFIYTSNITYNFHGLLFIRFVS